MAAILVGAGLAVCLAGYIVSRVGGEQLFAGKLDSGERGYTYYFRDGDLDILRLSVDDADINIIGGADEAHMEIINFNESLYSFEISNAMVTFRQSPDLSSLASFWESGITFKGLRYFFNPGTGHGKGCINIYINSDEYIKVFDLTSSKGKISISNVDSKSDYQLHPGSGGISLENISAASTVNITSSGSGAVEIGLSSLFADNVNITAPQAKLSAKGLSCSSLNIQQGSGTVDVEYIPQGEYTLDIATVGKLSVNGENYIDTYTYPPKDQGNTQQSSASSGDKQPDEENISHVNVNTSVSSSDASVSFTVIQPVNGGADDKE